MSQRKDDSTERFASDEILMLPAHLLLVPITFVEKGVLAFGARLGVV